MVVVRYLPSRVLYTDFTELLHADRHRKAILMPVGLWARAQTTILALQA